MNLLFLKPKYWMSRLRYLSILRKFDVIMLGDSFASNCVFEGRNLLNYASVKNCYLGEATYLSGGTQLKDVSIGRYCSIGQNVKNGFSIHPSSEFVSSHPAFYSLKKQAGFTFVKEQRFKETVFIDSKYRIKIGNDVWIGNNVTLMDGICIGNGAIIATGSIVTKDVEPYTIVGGVPAKFIRDRFEKDQVCFLQDFKWWDKGKDWIEKNHIFFNNITQFIKMNHQSNPRDSS